MGHLNFFALLLFSGIIASHASKWSYTGDAGPLYWHELFPDACSGKYQSPIDIRPEMTMYNPELKEFALFYDPPKPDTRMILQNNGHSVKIALEGDLFVTNGGLEHVYKSAQFHFHWGHKAHHGSEHLVDGKPSPIELHIVNYNHDLYSNIGEAVTVKGGLAVLGVMFEVTNEDNPVLEPIVKGLKHIRDPENQPLIELPLISLRDLLPNDMTRYYRYNGSLTTPGCFESVIWTVFADKQTISHRQLKEFTTMLQFRHKHHKHSGAANRHKRSLNKAQRRMERRAEDVLEELGIKGNEFEETVFKTQMMEEKQRQMMLADMPAGSSDHKPAIDEGRAANIDKSIDEHMGHTTNDKYHAAVDPTQDTPAEVVDYEYIQEVIVNNFRPVQPLNGRLVYRSFKLREPVVTVDIEPDHSGPSHAHVAPTKGHDGHENGAGLPGVSAVVLALVSMLAVLLV